MTITGECLGEPATLEVDGDRVSLCYVPKPGAARVTTPVEPSELRLARFRGLEPFHAFALFFAIGAYFARMPWLAAAFAAGGIGHAISRLVRPPQVLVLGGGQAMVVSRGSLEQARELVTRRAAR